MPIMSYCWRCRTTLPMLDDAEWEQFAPLLANRMQSIKDYRTKHGCSLMEAREKADPGGAISRYFAITGYRETWFDNLFHHRRSAYGPDCEHCGKAMRSPRAKFCAACGAGRE